MKSGMIEMVAAIFVLFTAMMNPMLSAVLAIATLIALGVYHWREEKKTAGGSEAVNEERAAAKRAAVEKVFAEIQQKGEMTNDGVQALLGVSDATAERYLQELESAGRIRQVGEAGKSVSYKIH